MKSHQVAIGIYIISDVLKNILCRNQFKYSFMPDIIEKIYLHGVIFMLTQILYLFEKNKSFKTIEIMIGIVYSIFYLRQFEILHRFGFQFDYSLGLVIEIFGITMIAVVSELISGRKSKIERNTFMISLACIILASFIIPEILSLSSLFVLGNIIFLRSFVFNMLKHVFIASSEISKITIVTSSIILIKNIFSYSSANVFEINKMQDEVMENKMISLCLLIVMVVNYFSDIVIFKNFDIDSIFILKTLSMLITLIYEKLNFRL